MASFFVFLLLLLAAATASAASDELSPLQQYKSWAASYNRTVSERRFQIFQDNMKMIRDHNAAADRGESSYRLGLTPFADLTYEEFKASTSCILGLPSLHPRGENNNFKALPAVDSLEHDWRKYGVVTPVKDQGLVCGSCWAFSIIAAVESMYLKYHPGSDLNDLAEQQLIDCLGYGLDGCKGGKLEAGYKHMISDGAAQEHEYPYVGKYQKCKRDVRAAVFIDEYGFAPPYDENALKQAVYMAPVSAAMAVGPLVSAYKDGIFKGPCDPEPSHAVLIVGFGTDDGKDYWILKNSWGTGWGEGGYMRILRNTGIREGICNISFYTIFPVDAS